MRFKSFSIDGKKVKSLMIDGFKVKFVEEEEGGPLCMTAVVGSPNVSLNKVGAAPDVNLQYSYDNSTWTPYTVGQEVNIPEGGKLYWKAVGSNLTFAINGSRYNKFYAHNGFIRLDGDLNSLLEEENYEGMSLAGRPNYVLAGLFRDCVGLGMVGDIFTSDVLSNNCYTDMFNGCTQLAEVPSVLPAMNLSGDVYYRMFKGCSAIEKAPRLPATTLKQYCYEYMFEGCSSLTQAPELPATTLADYCYNRMFIRCTSLTQAPKLPAMNLNNECYAYMFTNCSSLTQAPELPATELKQYCYEYMFSGCKALVEAPELPATTLATACYYNMFNGCSKLNEVKVGFTSWGNQTTSWLNNVASTGKFIAPQELIDATTTRGGSTVPAGWTMVVDEPQCLKFTSLNAPSTVRLNKYGSPQDVNLQYSRDGETWTPYTIGNTLTLANVGDKVYISAIGSNDSFSISSGDYYKFNMNGRIKADGNVNSLLEEDYEVANTMSLEGKNYCFYALFSVCHSLTQAPKLPATTLGDSCYSTMFMGCESLTQAPELPATTLGESCYTAMFYGCSSLEQAPELPATTLKPYCYMNMFNGCEQLVEAPALLAERLTHRCYFGMFSNCENIDKMRVGFRNWGSESTESWLNNVSNIGEFYCHDELVRNTTTRGASTIPVDWTIIDIDKYEGLKFSANQANSTLKLNKYGSSAPVVSIQYSTDNGTTWSDYSYDQVITLANVDDSVCFKAKTTNGAFGTSSYTAYNKWIMTGSIRASGTIMSLLDGTNYMTLKQVPTYAFPYMFIDCKSLTEAPEMPATILGAQCYQGMFLRCSNLEKVPELPAKQLLSYSYGRIFDACSKVNDVSVRFTSWGSSTNENWLANVASTGTFHCPQALIDKTTTRGSSTVPAGWTMVSND